LTPLACQTPAGWAASMVEHRHTLLVDQAHLEKKAAAGAMAFLFRVPTLPEQQRALSALAREELVHFERCLRLLGQRQLAFGPLRPSAYAAELKRAIATTMPERLVDELLVAAIVEARSCERMALLAAALQPVDAELADFYADLVEAEARHTDVYGWLAAECMPAADLPARWQRLLLHESAVLQALPFAPRLHGGLLDGTPAAALPDAEPA
jgi:tRNA-(ms[2]io[6]A)-hydroxylase